MASCQMGYSLSRIIGTYFSQAELRGLWTHLRHEEPELLDTFEYFVDNAVREIDKIQSDRNFALKR